MAAIRSVNKQIHKLAPVINTQSLRFNFGEGLDTMLKVSNGYAYVFSMIAADSQPGQRKLVLPEQIDGRKVEVLFESRNLDVDPSGSFFDDFNQESAYHIYKVKL